MNIDLAALLCLKSRRSDARFAAGELKKRGYRWNAGDDGRPKSWFIDLDEEKCDDEIAYLRSSIYLRDVDLLIQTITALDRFSVRG